MLNSWNPPWGSSLSGPSLRSEASLRMTLFSAHVKKPQWPCTLRLRCYPGGRPSSFWCCAALQCISPPVLSSPAVGCCKKITSRCHCWFIKLNCFLLLCVLCLSGTSWESLEPEHGNCSRVHNCRSSWNVFSTLSLSLFFGNLYCLLSLLSLAMTSHSASLSVSRLS